MYIDEIHSPSHTSAPGSGTDRITMRTRDPELWWKSIKETSPDEFELRLRSSFRYTIRQYMRNSSIKGIRYVTDRRHPRLVRFCYALVILIATVGMCVLIPVTLSSSGQSSLSVSQELDVFPLSEVDFPAVGLCSSGRISRESRDEYAAYLHSLDKNSTFTLNQIKTNLLAFLGIIHLSASTYDPKFLDFLKEKLGEINVTDILYQLSPKCERLLLRCGWAARRVTCDKLFGIRLTEFGFCCIFNSRYLSIDKNNSVFRATKTGPDEGLQVVIKDNSQDFVRRVRPANDVQIMLFDGNQHPLARAGVIRVYSSGRNSFVFLSLRARMRLADPELAGYEDTWLGCGSRSWSQCISECRARMLRALCLCTPFDQPTQTVCSLEHLECLAKYREKLKYFYPGEDVHESLREEKANAIHCEHCIPNCNVQHYSALMDVVPYGEHSYKIHRDNFMQGLKLMNTSVIRVYFRNSQQEIQVIELNRRWYESLISHSSLVMSLAGVTVVSLTELMFHLILLWVNTHRKTPTTPRTDY
ncbi:pickpocket protein 28-like isoform X1 [Danaus plexippus]|uniref:pickpocket protein 28-like isoform X1 n=1 Tax=Danaus plexippus TaxID=13037 RepID=UPI002AAF1569|nr:pickpocket protein 28-like isoform X1 [Danaus plexippus]